MPELFHAKISYIIPMMALEFYCYSLESFISTLILAVNVSSQKFGLSNDSALKRNNFSKNFSIVKTLVMSTKASSSSFNESEGESDIVLLSESIDVSSELSLDSDIEFMGESYRLRLKQLKNSTQLEKEMQDDW